MAIDLGQLVVALIGATSTLLAALLSSRSRAKQGAVPSKRSVKRRLVKFGFYFLLGGGATYWVMNWLLPASSGGNPLQVFSGSSNPIGESGVAFAQGLDSVSPPSLPVGSVLLSVLPPDTLGGLPGGASYWAIADGRMLNRSTSYAMMTGRTTLPDLRGLVLRAVGADTSASDSITAQSRADASARSERNATVYWYIRIN